MHHRVSSPDKLREFNFISTSNTRNNIRLLNVKTCKANLSHFLQIPCRSCTYITTRLTASLPVRLTNADISFSSRTFTFTVLCLAILRLRSGVMKVEEKKIFLALHRKKVKCLLLFRNRYNYIYVCIVLYLHSTKNNQNNKEK